MHLNEVGIVLDGVSAHDYGYGGIKVYEVSTRTIPNRSCSGPYMPHALLTGAYLGV